MEKRYYVCPAGHIAKTMIYPVDDPELCPRLPEHSECDVCHKVLIELDGPAGDQTGKPGQPLVPQPPRPHEAKPGKVK